MTSLSGCLGCSNLLGSRQIYPYSKSLLFQNPEAKSVQLSDPDANLIGSEPLDPNPKGSPEPARIEAEPVVVAPHGPYLGGLLQFEGGRGCLGVYLHVETGLLLHLGSPCFLLSVLLRICMSTMEAIFSGFSAAYQLNHSSSSASLAAMDELLELCNSSVPPLLLQEISETIAAAKQHTGSTVMNAPTHFFFLSNTAIAIHLSLSLRLSLCELRSA
ncbi:hypothetical protein ACFX14_019686 [Malus domestica]